MRWFKHLSDSADDERIAAYLAECGGNPLEGYGFWWRLLEIVAKQMTKTSTYPSVTYPLPHWVLLLYSHRNRVGKYIGKLEVAGLIETSTANGKMTVTIPNLLKYRDEYSRKSGHTPEPVRSDSGQTPDQETDTDTEVNTTTSRPVDKSVDNIETRETWRDRIPEDWKPPDHLYDQLRMAGCLVDPHNAIILTKFISHHRGIGTLSDDWPAMYLNWCLREKTTGGTHGDQRAENRSEQFHRQLRKHANGKT